MHPTVNIGGEEYAVKLVEVDNKSDKTEAVNAAQKLVSEKVSVVLGSYGSGVSIAAGQIFADAKIPAIGCSCTNPQVTEGNDYYFRVCFIDPFQGTVMANYAFQNGAKSAAVITQLGDDYSSGLGSYFKEAFAKLGGNIVSEEQFQTNQTDFKAILTNIKAADPDIIFAPSSITTAPLIIKQARELGITATIAAGDTWENSTIIENAGADSEGVVISTFFDEAEPANDEAAAFIKGFMSQENAKPFHFLKVAADKASEVTQSLLRLADNPKDPEGLKALYDHRVTSYQLEKVKFDTPVLKLQELKEMGIIVTPKELEAMKHGLPTTDLHDVTLKIGNIPVAGQFALHPYKDMNGDVQVGLTSRLASGVRARRVPDDVLHE